MNIWPHPGPPAAGGVKNCSPPFPLSPSVLFVVLFVVGASPLFPEPRVSIVLPENVALSLAKYGWRGLGRCLFGASWLGQRLSAIQRWRTIHI
jgi:hypothetical protein